MNRNYLKIALVGVAAFAACILAPIAKAAANNSDSLFPDKVVARGPGFEIRQSQLDDMFLSFKANRSAVGQPLPDAMRPRVYADILEKLIATQLFMKRATTEDKDNAKAIAQEFVQEQMKRVPSEQAFNRQLLATGMSREQFETQVAEQAVVKAVIDREVKSKFMITDEQAKKYYDENPTLFTQPELAHVSHILISTRDTLTGRELSEEQKADKKKLAEKLVVRAREGEDFAKLVKEYSDDSPSKERNGEYTIPRAKDDPRRAMVAEFEAVAFALRPNQVSDVVSTRFGFHIIKGKEIIPAKKAEFETVSNRIKETLIQEEVQKHLPELIEKMKKESGVEVFQIDI